MDTYAYIMDETGDPISVDLSDLTTRELSALRKEANAAGDYRCVAIIDRLLEDRPLSFPRHRTGGGIDGD